MKVLLSVTDTLHFYVTVEVPDGLTKEQIQEGLDNGEIEYDMDNAGNFNDETEINEITMPVKELES